MAVFLLSGVADVDPFCRKIKRLTTCTVLVKATCPYHGPGVLICWISEGDNKLSLEVQCSEDALIDEVSYCLGYREVGKVPDDIARLYNGPGKPGRPIVQLDAWNDSDGQQNMDMSYRAAVAPYMLEESLLLCIGQCPNKPLDWICLGGAADMGFDELGHLKGIRFSSLSKKETSLLRKMDIIAAFRQLWTKFFPG